MWVVFYTCPEADLSLHNLCSFFRFFFPTACVQQSSQAEGNKPSQTSIAHPNLTTTPLYNVKTGTSSPRVAGNNSDISFDLELSLDLSNTVQPIVMRSADLDSTTCSSLSQDFIWQHEASQDKHQVQHRWVLNRYFKITGNLQFTWWLHSHERPCNSQSSSANYLSLLSFHCLICQVWKLFSIGKYSVAGIISGKISTWWNMIFCCNQDTLQTQVLWNMLPRHSKMQPKVKHHHHLWGTVKIMYLTLSCHLQVQQLEVLVLKQPQPKRWPIFNQWIPYVCH
jgi:hypothetical protein